MAKATPATDAELQDRRAQIEAAMENLTGLQDDEAADIVARADALLAQREDRLGQLRAQRDAIDQEFGIRRKQRADEAAQQRQQEYLRLRKALIEDEEARLHEIQNAEAHLTAALDAINAAVAAHGRQRATAKAIVAMSGSDKIPNQFDALQFTNRLMGRFASIIRAKNKGRIAFSYFNLAGQNAYFDHPTDWRSQEERESAPAVAQLIGY